MDVFADYLASIDNPEQRERAEEVFRWITHKFPNLTPRIAWSQLIFTDHGTFIIGFSIAKHHMSFTPEVVGINHFSDEILKAGYDYTKGLVRIPWSSPVDYLLLEKVIEFNILDKAECSTFWRK